MATPYSKHFSTRTTPQSEPIPGKEMVENSAGGFTFQIDDWARLQRWLILGAEGGTYYASEKKLTKENALTVLKCLNLDPKKTVDTIVEVSVAGRAPKNDPAIFALAIAAGHDKGKVFVTPEAVQRVCRIGTHLFQFAEAVQGMRGWGRRLRRCIAEWYTSKEPKDLAYQVTKYQQRNGWSHRDLLRLSHPKPSEGIHPNKGSINMVLRWATGKQPPEGQVTPWAEMDPAFSLQHIIAFERAKKASTKQEIVSLIRTYGLVRECIPTQFLTEPEVWEALLEKMPLTAMIRNLATMTKIDLLAPMSNGVGKIVKELADVERIKKARVHPIALLAALKTYAQGHGERGKSTWNPVSQITDALDGAFYLAFKAVEPTNKRWLLALDVSGSMDMGNVSGVPGLTPRVGSAAMALITAATEAQHAFVAFTSGGWHSNQAGRSQWAGWGGMGQFNGITPVDISPRQRLDDVCQKVAKLPMGGTDCALPMLYAAEQKIPVDVFTIYTDNETWANPHIHPCQALVKYREKMGIPAKLIVVGMTATSFSIADPNDGGQMDVVGFDASAPSVMADFAR